MDAQAINENRDDWEPGWEWWMEKRRDADGRRLIRADAQTRPVSSFLFGRSIINSLVFRLVDVRFNLLHSLVTFNLRYIIAFGLKRVSFQGKEGSGSTKPSEIRS
jgi:hypothetical protein